MQRGEGPLHRIYSVLASKARAEKVGRVGSFKSPTETTVVRIVLTGGPCAGKSSSLTHLTEELKLEGFDVYVAPEMATLVFNCGFQWPDDDDPKRAAKILSFQTALFKLQLQLERSMTVMAAATGRPSIIIFDRGLMDGKGYMEPEWWEQLLHDVAHVGRDVVLLGRDVSEQYILQRYDGVIHMVTAAEGAAAFYKHGDVVDDAGNQVFRREAPTEAIALDHKTRRCWQDHPRHIVVENPPAPEDGGMAGFHKKLRTATQAVLEIARQVHPQTARAQDAV
jgi:predicted ATPase